MFTHLIDVVTTMSEDVFWKVHIDVVCVEGFFLNRLVFITEEWPKINRHNLIMKLSALIVQKH